MFSSTNQIASATTDVLCRGNNIYVAGGSTFGANPTQPVPLNPGGFHARKVAFDDAPEKVYAILCNENIVPQNVSLPPDL